MKTKLQEILERCSETDLKNIIGENLVDLLAEWDIGQDSNSIKRTLAKTILGTNSIDKLMADKSFRGLIFDHSTKSEQRANALKSTRWVDSDSVKKIAEELEINYDLLFPIIDVVTHPTVQSINNDKRFFELLDYQFMIKQRAIDCLAGEGELKKLLIQMPTGTGKTKTTVHIITEILNKNSNSTVIWMAHTKELLEQAYETFTETFNHIGSGNVSIVRLWGESAIVDSDLSDKNIIFTSIQKLSSIKNNHLDLFNFLKKSCTLLVVDEAHKAAASDTKNTISEFMKKEEGMEDRSLVGLTATPGRSSEDDDENKRLAMMFDSRIFTIDPKLIENFGKGYYKVANTNVSDDIISYLQDRSILSILKKEDLEYELSLAERKEIEDKLSKSGDDINNDVLKLLSEKVTRNTAILKKLKTLGSNNIPTIVFCCSVEHGKLLSAALNNAEIDNVCVFGDMDNATRSNNIRLFKTGEINIIINFGVLTTGFDSTNIRCVMITRPTNSPVLYSQMIGRGLRGPKMGGNKECLLVDVKDNLGKYNENLAYKQFNNYWNI